MSLALSENTCTSISNDINIEKNKDFIEKPVEYEKDRDTTDIPQEGMLPIENRDTTADVTKKVKYFPQDSVANPIESIEVRVLQKWEGVITDIKDSSIYAIVKDLTNFENEEERVEFEKDEISDDDLELLDLGAHFYWYIGVQKEPSGQRSNISKIVFQRLPVLRRKDLEKISYKDNDLIEVFRGR